MMSSGLLTAKACASCAPAALQDDQHSSQQDTPRQENLTVHRHVTQDRVRTEVRVFTEDGANVEVEELTFELERPRTKYWLGVECQPASEGLRSHLNLSEGLLIESVAPESPASRFGLERFDVIVEFAGQEVGDIPQLSQLIEERGEEESQVLLIRRGEPTRLTLRGELRPALELAPTVTRLDSIANGENDNRPFERVVEHFRGQNPHHQLQLVVVRPGMIVGRAPVRIQRELQLSEDRILRVVGSEDGPIQVLFRDADESSTVVLDANRLASMPEDIQRAAAIEVQRLRWLDVPVEVEGEKVQLFPPAPFAMYAENGMLINNEIYNMHVTARPIIAPHPNIHLKQIELHLKEEGSPGEAGADHRRHRLRTVERIERTEAELKLRIEMLESELGQMRRELDKLGADK